MKGNENKSLKVFFNSLRIQNYTSLRQIESGPVSVQRCHGLVSAFMVLDPPAIRATEK